MAFETKCLFTIVSYQYDIKTKIKTIRTIFLGIFSKYSSVLVGKGWHQWIPNLNSNCNT